MGSGWTVTEQPCRACFRVPVSETFICEPCMDQLHADLYVIPDTARELETEIIRASRKTSGRADSERPLPYNPAASACLHELKTALVDAVFIVTIGQQDDLPEDTIPALCAWLSRHEQSIALRADGGRVVTNLASILRHARAIIDTPPEKVYVGKCHCDNELYRTVGQQVVTCPNPECDQDWDADMLTEQRNDRARDHLMSLADIALLAKIPRGTLHGWVKRDRRLIAKGEARDGTVLYRYGDALALNESRRLRMSA